jgi:dystroglycan 1
MHFECDNKKCIPQSYQCDKEQDCDDGTDELGCSAPTVIRYPQRMNNVTEGSTVQLYCDAVGTTTPVISWRLNWGNVPPPPRVTMTSDDGRGVLTIRNVGMKDQGAYTCEAMNSEGSVLATPDAIVNVIESDEDCPPGQFNKALPGNEPLCTDCFCFGVTNECEPIHVKVNEIGIDFADGGEDIRVRLRPPGYGDENPPMPVRNTQIHINPASGQLELVDLSKRFMKAAQYWSMPEEFAGYKSRVMTVL